MEKQRRVMLKLSGEALAGEKKTGFDEEVVKDVARQAAITQEITEISSGAEAAK